MGGTSRVKNTGICERIRGGKTWRDACCLMKGCRGRRIVVGKESSRRSAETGADEIISGSKGQEAAS